MFVLLLHFLLKVNCYWAGGNLVCDDLLVFYCLCFQQCLTRWTHEHSSMWVTCSGVTDKSLYIMLFTCLVVFGKSFCTVSYTVGTDHQLPQEMTTTLGGFNKQPFRVGSDSCMWSFFFCVGGKWWVLCINLFSISYWVVERPCRRIVQLHLQAKTFCSPLNEKLVFIYLFFSFFYFSVLDNNQICRLFVLFFPRINKHCPI